MTSVAVRLLLVAVAVALVALAALSYAQQPNPPSNQSPAGDDRPTQVSREPPPALAINSTKELTPQEVFKLVEGSVVSITARFPAGGRGQGSGFVYDTAGHIVTNNHVVQNARSLEVSFTDGSTVKATLVGADPYSDLAVLKVILPSGRHDPLPLGDSSLLEVGQPILAIGNPLGLSGSMTYGIVSQLGRQLNAPGGFLIVGVIQIDAAINPGNSGGPLLDLRGHIVGVNTAIASQTGLFSGIGFAVPSNIAKRFVPSLITTGTARHPWIGVSGVDVTPAIADTLGLRESRGFLVGQVLPQSPAERGGLKGGNRAQVIEDQQIVVGGDVIVGVESVKVRRIDDILLYLEENIEVGRSVVFRILRDGQPMDLNLVVGERPPPSQLLP